MEYKTKFGKIIMGNLKKSKVLIDPKTGAIIEQKDEGDNSKFQNIQKRGNPR